MLQALINCGFIAAGYLWDNTIGYYLKNPLDFLFAVTLGLSPVFCVYLATA